MLMAVAGVPTTNVGALLARLLSQRFLLIAFALVMLVVATRLLRQSLKQSAAAAPGSDWCIARLNPETGRLAWTWATAGALAAIGAVTGLMTGLLGVGGGFIIVPMMKKLTNLSMHGVVATSLMVITLVGGAGVFATLHHSGTFSVEVALWFSVATASGMLVGRMASHRLSGRHVQLGFASILVCVSLGLFAKAILMTNM